MERRPEEPLVEGVSEPAGDGLRRIVGYESGDSADGPARQFDVVAVIDATGENPVGIDSFDFDPRPSALQTQIRPDFLTGI